MSDLHPNLNSRTSSAVHNHVVGLTLLSPALFLAQLGTGNNFRPHLSFCPSSEACTSIFISLVISTDQFSQFPAASAK